MAEKKTLDDVGNKLPTEEERKEARRKFLEKLDGTRCTVAMTGLCGAGKSTLRNTLLLRRACKEARGVEAVTKRAGHKFLPINLDPQGMAIIELVDTPGLNGFKDNDELARTELKGVGSIDLLLICCAMTDDGGRYMPLRMEPLIAMISELFSKDDLEKKAVFILTMAKCNTFDINEGGKESFEAAVTAWKGFHRKFCEEKGYSTILNIPVLVVGKAEFDDKDELQELTKVAGSDEWMSKFWAGISERGDEKMTSLFFEYWFQAKVRYQGKVKLPEIGMSTLQKVFVFTFGAAAVGATGGAALGAFLPAVSVGAGAAAGGLIASVSGGMAAVANRLMFWKA